MSAQTELPSLDLTYKCFIIAAIPFIVHPIDNGIHGIMNVSLRPALRRYVCGPGQGSLAELKVCDSEECVPVEAGKQPLSLPPSKQVLQNLW